MKKKIWLYWWTTISAMHTGSFVRTTYSTRRLTSAQVTAHDRANGWPVSKVKRMKVDHPGEPVAAKPGKIVLPKPDGKGWEK